MSPQEKLNAARQILTKGNPLQALVLFEQIVDDQPMSSLHQEAMIGASRALAQLGHIGRATDTAHEALNRWPDDYSVLLINAECAKLAGNGTAEEAFCRRAFAAAPDKLITATTLCQKLLATHQWDALQDVHDSFVKLTKKRAPLLSFQALKHTYAGEASEGLAIWQEILEQPGIRPAKKLQALKGVTMCLVQTEDYSELRKLFESYPETGSERPALLSGLPANPSWKGMQFFPNSLLRAAAELRPQNAAAETAYQQRISQLGTFEGFSEVASRQFERRGIIRTHLSDQIAAISVPQKQIKVTQKLLSFWKLCGEPYGTLNEWLVAKNWEAQANDLTRLFTFMEIEDEDQVFEQISDITVPPDYTLIHEALEKNSGCLLAGSHLGPVWAHAFLTSRHFENLGIIGGKPRPRLGRGDKDVSMRREPVKARRDIQKHLSQNAIMWCGPDSVHKTDPKNLFDSAFGPLPVQISYAHIQFRTGAPGLWSERYWKDKQIHISFKKMPSPEPDEGLKDYTKRWCETYLAYLTDLIKHRLADSQFAQIIGRDWTY
ncbi:tetratricopeptide repeat protein [Pelagimonas varians]|uniref:Tetratricopeptide repeat protein n=1 Tax=Pelagimonas varians TaxID=696760 RepID=A0A238L6F0_9RHOB|nr:hypothetical protein [Pelagimonas varians]PYG25011.1 hypothetical protein C8N36_1423 [Pelagimonas varians]SMX50665.1 hypothetical protein PEV8663_04751 [Pelagimonas varians]